MSDNIDEKILDIINAKERVERYKNLEENEIKIGKEYYIFKEFKFYDNKLIMYLPSDFSDMKLELRKIKYPYEDRPEIIRCNNDGSICFTLKIIDSPLNEDKVETLTNGMKEMMQRLNPANVFFDMKIEKANEKNIGYFDFKTTVIDGFLYNIMFFFEFKGKTAFGGFSCKYSDCNDWRDIVIEVIKKIRVIEEE
ncbi:hypothetical protein KQI30_07245 [Clostridium bornimense]|uniref:hypothetical protein n=1 Tax=Clostridium bornimense TaxID=1216932 RepID=UPI001C119BF8|nr:hypothetical protein [Clostridium bornimense]MBU5316063.1 hypothetical protein [Clostridium bornimense]